MSYREKFNFLLKATVKGMIIGLFITIGLVLLMSKGSEYKITTLLTVILSMWPVIGIATSMIFYGMDLNKSGNLAGVMEGSVFGIIGSFVAAASGSLLGACIILILGFIFLIPCVAYMGTLYVLHFIFYGIMTYLESKGNVNNSEAISLAESIINIVPVAVAIFAVFMTLSSF